MILFITLSIIGVFGLVAFSSKKVSMLAIRKTKPTLTGLTIRIAYELMLMVATIVGFTMTIVGGIFAICLPFFVFSEVIPAIYKEWKRQKHEVIWGDA